MIYTIAAYDTSSDKLAAAVPLSPSEVPKIKELLGYDSDMPLWDCYPLTGETLVKLREFLGHRLPRGEYEYFLEAEEE